MEHMEGHLVRFFVVLTLKPTAIVDDGLVGTFLVQVQFCGILHFLQDKFPSMVEKDVQL